jgi:hypothetical protein
MKLPMAIGVVDGFDQNLADKPEPDLKPRRSADKVLDLKIMPEVATMARLMS